MTDSTDPGAVTHNPRICNCYKTGGYCQPCIAVLHTAESSLCDQCGRPYASAANGTGGEREGDGHSEWSAGCCPMRLTPYDDTEAAEMSNNCLEHGYNRLEAALTAMTTRAEAAEAEVARLNAVMGELAFKAGYMPLNSDSLKPEEVLAHCVATLDKNLTAEIAEHQRHHDAEEAARAAWPVAGSVETAYPKQRQPSLPSTRLYGGKVMPFEGGECYECQRSDGTHPEHCAALCAMREAGAPQPAAAPKELPEEELSHLKEARHRWREADNFDGVVNIGAMCASLGHVLSYLEDLEQERRDGLGKDSAKGA